MLEDERATYADRHLAHLAQVLVAVEREEPPGPALTALERNLAGVSDAVTSAVSYVLSRPFRAIAYFAMTCLMIWATAAFLAFLVQLAESITTCLISFGEGVWSARGDGRSDKTSQFLMECWLGGLHYIARGAVTCVFFSGSLVSFLLLRGAVDGKGRGEVDGVGVDAAPPSFVEPVDTP